MPDPGVDLPAGSTNCWRLLSGMALSSCSNGQVALVHFPNWRRKEHGTFVFDFFAESFFTESSTVVLCCSTLRRVLGGFPSGTSEFSESSSTARFPRPSWRNICSHMAIGSSTFSISFAES